MENKKYDIGFQIDWWGMAIGATIMMIILKCLNFIDCTWLWVFAPMLVVVGCMFLLVFVVGLISIYYFLINNQEEDGDEEIKE